MSRTLSSHTAHNLKQAWKIPPSTQASLSSPQFNDRETGSNPGTPSSQLRKDNEQREPEPGIRRS